MKINIKSINLWDIFILLNLIALSGAVIYRLYKLNFLGVLLTLVFSTLGFLFFQKIKIEQNTPFLEKIKNLLKKDKETKNKFLLLFPFVYLSLFIISYFILFKSSTSNSIISPWQVVPFYFFIIYTLSTFTLFLILKKNHPKIGLFFVSAHFFLSLSVALIVYKIGYGFDPFIHEATLKLIKENGFVEPKPFYYLGQYSLIIVLNKILFIPISFLNSFLVPLLASIFIPKVIFEYFEKAFDDKKTSLMATVATLILPFSFLIMTTPQNLAYLLLVIIIIKSLKINSYYDLLFLYLMASTALLTQAVAGIPAFLFVIIINIYYSEIKFKKIFTSFVFVSMAIILPLSFYFFQNSSGHSPEIKNNYLQNITSTLVSTKNLFFSQPIIPSQENFILNFIYLYAFNLKTIIILLFLSGLYLSFKHKKECKIFIHFFYASLALFIAYLLGSSLDYSFLVDYERSDYPQRILLISIIFLLPYFLLSIYYFFYKLKDEKYPIQIPVLLIVSTLITSSLYISYPRFDNYHNSRGYSVGQYDIEATKWIEENQRRAYLVLANQQVSAAALKNFGFNKYFSQNIFYYPIPTSSPLYDYYLEMVYDRPSKENIKKAMDLVNINEAYFVLNKYWWAFPKILEEAKLEADSYTSFGDGEVYVFKYLR